MATKNTNNDFIAAIYQIAEERGIAQEAVLDQVKKAYLTAYKKMVKEETNPGEELNEEEDDSTALDVDIDADSGEIVVLADKKVVGLITDQRTQILESQAKMIDPRLREGDHIQIDVTPENFGRIAAQAALQRLMQGLRDAEFDTMVEKYRDKVGKIISGIIQRKDPNYVRVEIERAEAVMPNQEQIPGEYYRSSERKRFLLQRLSNTATDKRMVLSRASGDFLKALFEVEVPEVATGSVEIVNVAREAGSRSKVAVHSLHEKVDAIGSCVGPRGTRIDSIMTEINPEKVDIILWDAEIERYVINALSPAKVVDVKIDTEEGYAKVLVNEDVLSLAIGKDGQNVRLAAKLTGYKIDITASKEQFEKEGRLNDVRNFEKVEPLAEIDTVTEPEVKAPSFDALELTDRQKKLLSEAAITSIDQLKEVAAGELEVAGFTKRDVEKIKGLV
jgi:transcription termination/antitermination protein NusA